MQGAYVPPEAYAAFVRGAIAESLGSYTDAVASYERAHEWDEDDPMILARVGRARCLADPKDTRADAAFTRALDRDGEFADVWAAKAKCAERRGQSDVAEEAWARALAFDPRLGAESSATTRKGEDPGGKTRDALLASTIAAGGGASAWDALADYALAHGDMALASRALAEVARRSSALRESVLRRARALVGAGYRAEGEASAGAVIDAFVDGAMVPRSKADVRALVDFAGKVAIDEALARGDVALAEARAVRAHLPNDEVMGRAFLAGRVETASRLATERLRAEPDHVGASIVLWLSGGASPFDPAVAARARSSRVSAAVRVALGRSLRVSFDAPEVHAILARIPHHAPSAGDPLLASPLAELLAARVVDEKEATPEAILEAKLREGELRSSLAKAAVPDADARHRLLWLSLTSPDAKETRELARRLAPASSRDPWIAMADVILARAGGRTVAQGTFAQVLAKSPSSALLAGLVLDAIANSDKTGPEAARARTLLAATAITERERNLAGPAASQ